MYVVMYHDLCKEWSTNQIKVVGFVMTFITEIEGGLALSQTRRVWGRDVGNDVVKKKLLKVQIA